MARNEYADAALVLIGHGSTLNAESAAPTHQHADVLRARGLFAQVVTGFWKQEPYVCGVLRGVFAPRVFIVPLFISEGYFTEEVIPRELGFFVAEPRIPQAKTSDKVVSDAPFNLTESPLTPALSPGGGEGERAGRTFPRTIHRGRQVLHYCGPVGTHPSMAGVLLARAREVVANEPAPPPPKETALFIAGHGTGNNENSRKTIERQVEIIRQLGVYAEVHPVFMEEEPRIGDCYQMAQAPNLIVVPFFISDGLHSYEDIPVLLGEEAAVVKARCQAGQPTWNNPTQRAGKRVWYAASIGSEPQMAEVILERVREMSKEQ